MQVWVFLRPSPRLVAVCPGSVCRYDQVITTGSALVLLSSLRPGSLRPGSLRPSPRLVAVCPRLSPFCRRYDQGHYDQGHYDWTRRGLTTNSSFGRRFVLGGRTFVVVTTRVITTRLITTKVITRLMTTGPNEDLRPSPRLVAVLSSAVALLRPDQSSFGRRFVLGGRTNSPGRKRYRVRVFMDRPTVSVEGAGEDHRPWRRRRRPIDRPLSRKS